MTVLLPPSAVSLQNNSGHISGACLDTCCATMIVFITSLTYGLVLIYLSQSSYLFICLSHHYSKLCLNSVT